MPFLMLYKKKSYTSIRVSDMDKINSFVAISDEKSPCFTFDIQKRTKHQMQVSLKISIKYVCYKILTKNAKDMD